MCIFIIKTESQSKYRRVNISLLLRILSYKPNMTRLMQRLVYRTIRTKSIAMAIKCIIYRQQSTLHHLPGPTTLCSLNSQVPTHVNANIAAIGGGGTLTSPLSTPQPDVILFYLWARDPWCYHIHSSSSNES